MTHEIRTASGLNRADSAGRRNPDSTPPPAEDSMYQVNTSALPGSDASRKFEGSKHGPSSVSFFLEHNNPGDGPRLHHHPYDETFLITEGRVLIQVGDEQIEGGPGDIVIGPPGIPHGFTNPGPGKARLICIHAAPAMHTEFLQ